MPVPGSNGSLLLRKNTPSPILGGAWLRVVPLTRCLDAAEASLCGPQIEDETPLLRSERSNRKPVALAQYEHFTKRRVLAKHRQRQQRHWPYQAYVHREPSRMVGIAAGIVIRAGRIEGGRVRIRFRYDAHYTDNSRLRAARVIEKAFIIRAHRVPNQVSNLIIPHAIPARRLLCARL